MRINGKEIFEKGGLMFNLSRMASLEYQDKYPKYMPRLNIMKIHRKWQIFYIPNAKTLY